MTDVQRKKIIVHIGMPKTGSSALQEFLSCNARALEGQGVSYLDPEPESVQASGTCTGNLVHVMQRRASADRFSGSLDQLFDRYLTEVAESQIERATTGTVVMSSEALGRWYTGQTLAWLHDLSGRHEVTLLCFVRDPYDHAMSMWKQQVKAGQVTEDFISLCEGGAKKLSKVLLPYRTWLDSGLNVRFRNYDVVRKKLTDVFLAEVGVADAAGFTPLPRRPSNPSLSYAQARAVVLSAALTGSSRLTAELIKCFLENPGARPDPHLPAVQKTILEEIGTDIRDVNALLPAEERLHEGLRPPSSDVYQAFDEAEVVQILTAAARVIESRKQVIVSGQMPDLPADFDPEEYLARYADVAASGMDAAFHYLNHGRFEGRVYRTR